MAQFVKKLLGSLVTTSADAATQDQQNTGESKGTNSVSGQQGENLSTDLTNQLPKVYEGLSNIAETTEKIGAPAAKDAMQAVSGTPEQQGTLENDQGVMDTTYKTWVNTVNYANDQLDKFDKATTTAAAHAKIDPQAYQSRLGVSGNLISSIALLVSGIGSGLTGQPNMALDIFQKNIERDITAQQATYTNLQNAATQHLKGAQTAFAQAGLLINANAAAKVSIYKGVDSLLQSTQAAVGYGVAKDSVPLLRQKIQQALLDTYDNHATIYQNQVMSKDASHFNAVGLGAAAIADHAAGVNSPKLRDANPAQQRGLRKNFVPQLQTHGSTIPSAYYRTPSTTDPVYNNSGVSTLKPGEGN